jgi:uncharacterized membrane protein
VKKLLIFVLGISVLGFLIWASGQEIWKYHLAFDVRTFFERSKGFLSTNSFAGFETNEYLPVSLFFFILPNMLGSISDPDKYLNLIIFINLILIGVHLYIYKRINSELGWISTLLLFAAFGPILLFRFELLVSLLALFAVYLFKKEQYLYSGVLMGTAIATKVYPVFIVPYFLIILLRTDRRKPLLKYITGGLIGIIVPFLIYIFLKGNPMDVVRNIFYHVEKPVGVESIWASIISFVSLLETGILPQIVLKNGIWGILREGARFVDYLPYLSVVSFYLLLFFKLRKNPKLSVIYPMIALLIFLLFSKYLNPQYIFWVFAFLPLLKLKNFTSKVFLLNTFAIIILTQLIYPIYFSDLLSAFNSGNPNMIFYLLQTRNILLFLQIFILIKLARVHSLTSEAR